MMVNDDTHGRLNPALVRKRLREIRRRSRHLASQQQAAERS
jgi:hypothetical protein